MTQFSTLQHEADGLSAGLPPLMVQADHLAASVSLGVHGRRRAGIGESFWQFRRYASHDSSSAIDWRQSAKSQHIFVREREWEAAQTVWFWRDASANMVSSRAQREVMCPSATVPICCCWRWLRFWCAAASASVSWAWRAAASASRQALTRIGRAMFAASTAALPPPAPFKRGNQLVWFSDFLDDGIFDAMKQLSRLGVAGHLVQDHRSGGRGFSLHRAHPF